MISFPGGARIVASRTLYDREQLVEQVERFAERYGSIRLALARHRWTVSLDNAHREVCVSCSRWPPRLTYRVDGETLCDGCARAVLH